MQIHDNWPYKDYECIIEVEQEPDCEKAYHYVILPNGDRVFADISPYDKTRYTLQLWIKCEFPDRIGAAPLRRETLEDMHKSMQTIGNFIKSQASDEE